MVSAYAWLMSSGVMLGFNFRALPPGPARVAAIRRHMWVQAWASAFALGGFYFIYTNKARRGGSASLSLLYVSPFNGRCEAGMLTHPEKPVAPLTERREQAPLHLNPRQGASASSAALDSLRRPHPRCRQSPESSHSPSGAHPTPHPQLGAATVSLTVLSPALGAISFKSLGLLQASDSRVVASPPFQRWWVLLG